MLSKSLYLLFIILPAFLYPVMSPAAENAPAAESIWWVKDATQKYSPASWDLLMLYEKLPGELQGKRKGGWIVSIKKSLSTFSLLEGATGKADALARMAANVPCIALALQRFQVFSYTKTHKILLDWNRAEAVFYLSPSQTFYVSFPTKSLFPASDLASVIETDRRTPLFPEIIQENETTSRFGVVGLLEEFHARYFKCRFYLDMPEAYKIAENSEADGFIEWVRHSQSDMDAFYELDFFILEYLLHMKKHRPEDYRALKLHRSFGEAYRAILTAYNDVVDRYLKKIASDVEHLNASGQTYAALEGDIVWVRPPDSIKSKGAKVLPQKSKLLPVLHSGRYAEILADFDRKPRH